mmetsp:Transcript_6133/g.15235  ORF Transcript_6133/g.15235 Transcript_6133/m.15235 type:complete len:229 (-) Transcript_6133:130-816(-)
MIATLLALVTACSASTLTATLPPSPGRLNASRPSVPILVISLPLTNCRASVGASPLAGLRSVIIAGTAKVSGKVEQSCTTSASRPARVGPATTRTGCGFCAALAPAAASSARRSSSGMMMSGRTLEIMALSSAYAVSSSSFTSTASYVLPPSAASICADAAAMRAATCSSLSVSHAITRSLNASSLGGCRKMASESMPFCLSVATPSASMSSSGSLPALITSLMASML